MMPTDYTLAPYTTNKTLPSLVDPNDTTRKRKADVALGSPAESPLGHLRGKGVDEHDLDGLCIFDSLGIGGLTIYHDDNEEAHLIISSGGVSSMPLTMTHRHIIWGFHSVTPVVALPWREGPSADVPCVDAAGDRLFLSIADGDVDWLAEGVIDALLDGSEAENGCGLDSFDLPPPATTCIGADEAPNIVSADTAASPMHCDFYEIWPHLDVDKDLGQELSFNEI